MSLRGTTLLVLLLAGVQGCGGTTLLPECDVEGAVNLRVESAGHLNPDDDGDALPTVLRIYQLTELKDIETASFDELWNTPEELLEDAIVVEDELTIYPERVIERSFERNPDANYLLAMGLYRRPAGYSWRTILELPPPLEEQQCAAREAAEDPEDDVPQGVNPRVELYMDDYRIEGALFLEPAENGCTGLDCLDELAEDAASEAEGAGEEALPDTPDAPDAPDTPSTDTPSVDAPLKPSAPPLREP
ncbi:MAG: type VI secretion system lipoprotein TssJ [Myxococcota bacterium]